MSSPKKAHREGGADAAVLDQVARELGADLRAPKIDWAGIDESLFARVEEERRHDASLARFRGWRGWGGVAGLAAVAAAVALFAGRPPSRPTSESIATGGREGMASVAPPSGVSTLAARLGKGEVRVTAAGAKRAVSRVGVGDLVETDEARVLWEAGRTTWFLEENSRASVKAEVPLILALEQGAVEAQVDPVANGEAFAVDVGDLRIAVHGTHLRVARAADRVTVDLSEGVVSIGRPPRTGSTYGMLVVAPAHVEFELTDVGGAVVTHEVGAVRSPVAFTSLRSLEGAAMLAPSSPMVQLDAVALSQPHPTLPPNSAATTTTRPSTASHVSSVVAVGPRAEEAIAAAVRACASDAPHSSDVKVTVSSTLELTVGDDGLVRAARFNPPLAPEIQSCASTAIYKARFPDAGLRTIDLVLTR